LYFDVFINGLVYRFNKKITVDHLLSFLNCNKQAIAIEYNYSILKKEVWKQTIIDSKTKLEIVTIVGGG